MSQRAKYLEKNGWNCVSSKKRGMIRIQRWWKNGCGEMSQENAYNMQRQSDRSARLADIASQCSALVSADSPAAVPEPHFEAITNAAAKAREHGYAVIIWTPQELEGANPSRVQDRLVELGWDVISDLKPNTPPPVQAGPTEQQLEMCKRQCGAMGASGFHSMLCPLSGVDHPSRLGNTYKPEDASARG